MAVTFSAVTVVFLVVVWMGSLTVSSSDRLEAQGGGVPERANVRLEFTARRAAFIQCDREDLRVEVDFRCVCSGQARDHVLDFAGAGRAIHAFDAVAQRAGFGLGGGRLGH